MTTKRKITFSQDFTTFRIYIDGFIHCLIQKKSFVGFSSYKQDGIYYVEVWLKTKTVLLAHETKEFWLEILKLLDENL
jgi:hypothetical protein